MRSQGIHEFEFKIIFINVAISSCQWVNEFVQGQSMSKTFTLK